MSDTITLNVTVNGEARSVDVDPRRLLVEAIREELDLPGTHIGCLTGDCGACTIERDGKITKSCLVLAASAEGSEITTIEGLSDNGELAPLQQAFWDEYGFQCGYCLPGMLFAAKDLLEQNAKPNEDEIRHAINGNLCRCTGYDTIVKSIAEAANRIG